METEVALTAGVTWIDGLDCVPSGFQNGDIMAHLRDIEGDDEEEEEVMAAKEDDSEVVISQEGSHYEGTQKESETQERNPVSWLISPLIKLWDQMAIGLRRYQNWRLILRYFLRLQEFFGVDRVPPDIHIVFDCIFENYNKDFNLSTSGVFGDIGMVSAEAYPFESHATQQLQKLMAATLEVLMGIAAISSRIKAKLDEEGSLIIDSPEHLLCQTACDEMAYLVQRMEQLSSVLRRRSLSYSIHEEVIMALKVRVGICSQEVQDCFSKDISFSVAAKLELIFISVYEDMIRLSGCVCYYLQLTDLTELDHEKLLTIVSDFTICVKDLRDNIRTVKANYEYNTKKICSDIEESDNSHLLPSFSRESKIKRHCSSILNWTDEFAEHVKSMQIASSELVQLDPAINPDQYMCHVKEVENIQEVLYDYSKVLQTLLNTQSVLITDLSQRCNPVASHEQYHKQQNSHEATNRATTPDDSFSQEDIDQPIEFEIDARTDANIKIENDDEHKDEVYVGVFSDTVDEEYSQCDDESDPNTKMLQQLYSGVVHQLKSALIPVKCQMKLREKEAVTKLFGNVENLNEHCDEESLIHDLEDAGSEDEESLSEEDIAIPKIKKFPTKYRYDETDEQDNITTSTTHCDGDFMKELRLKLNAAQNINFLSGGNDEEFALETSSLSENDDDNE